MKDIQKDKSQEQDIKGFPLSVLYFYLTEGCNLACRHCWLAPKFDPDGSRETMLPLEVFKQAIEEAMPLGLTEVKLTGGEPLLNPEFMAMLDCLLGKDLRFVMETNGILLTPEIAEEIAKQKNPFISISLDGADAVTHDRIRGVEGAFTKTTTAVRSLAEKDLKPQVIMSIMQSNLSQVAAVIKLAEQLGAESVKFNIIQPSGRGESISTSEGLPIEQIIKLGQQVEKEMADKTSLKLYFDLPPAFQPLKDFADTGEGCRICSILSILGVLPDGSYALCGIGSHVRELVFGRVGRDSLAELWKSNPVLSQLREGLPDRLTGVCSHCLMKHRCLGACIAQNYYLARSLWAPFWFCDQAETEGFFPDSRLDFTFSRSEKMV